MSDKPVQTESNRLLHHRPFRLFFLSRLNSAAGAAFGQIGMVFAALAAGLGASGLGIILAASTVANLVALPLAGVLSDRHSRRTLLILTNVLSFLCQGAVALLVFTDSESVLGFAVLAVALGLARSIYTPATRGSLAELLPPDLMHKGNAMISLANSSSAILGSALGGALVGMVSPGAALLFASLNFLLAGALLAPIAAARPSLRVHEPFLTAIRIGWDAFRSRRWIWSSVSGMAVVNVAWTIGFSLLGPVAVSTRYSNGAQIWGLTGGALALGYIVGGLIAFRVRPADPLWGGTSLLLTFCLPSIALATHAPVAVLMGAAFLAGVGLECYGVYWYSTVQEKVPADLLSRVLAIDSTGSLAAIPVGYLLFGLTVGDAEPENALWTCALVIPVCVATMLAVGQLRRPQPVATATSDMPSR